jgi:hypothetical protein
MEQVAEAKDEVIVEVTLKPNDIYTPFQWNGTNVFCWPVILAACWVAYDSYSSNPAKWRVEGVPQTVAAFGVVALLALVLITLQYVRVRRCFQKYPAFKGRRDFRFTPDGVHVESEHVRGDYKWSLFSKVVETRKNFLLLQTATAAMYVPKRCFGSADDMSTLRELILKHFKGQRRLRAE